MTALIFIRLKKSEGTTNANNHDLLTANGKRKGGEGKWLHTIILITSARSGGGEKEKGKRSREVCSVVKELGARPAPKEEDNYQSTSQPRQQR